MFTPLAFNKESIVTDGLVFYVDAADRSSFSPGSGTWRDLTGNGNDGTLVNGPTFDSGNGGSIMFDGSNDYATTTYTMPAQSTTSSFTWFIWIYLPSGNSSTDVIFGNRYGPANLQFIKITPTNFEYYGGGAEHISYTVPTDQWINLCAVKNQTNHYYYSNASQVGNRTANNSIVANPVFMGADAYGNVLEPCNVKFAMAMIYEKALPPTEVTQNYNALKGRFGL